MLQFMLYLPIIAKNILDIVLAVTVSGLYAISTILLGSRIASRLGPDAEGLYVLIRFALGAAVFGSAFTILAWLKLAFAPLILVLAFLPLLFDFQSIRLRALPVSNIVGKFSVPSLNATQWVALIGIAAISFFPLTMSLALPRGSDMTIYHLVIPRTILWNHGLVFNMFSHDAGLFYGWQLYALPSYLLGGDRAFQFCSFIAFAILVFSTYKTFRIRYGLSVGLTGGLVIAAVICGMSRESVVNNDVPLVLLEFSLIAFAFKGETSRKTAWLLGGLCGFVVAVKLIAIATPLLAGMVFLWRTRKFFFIHALILIVAGCITFLPWPLYSYLASGSPVAHFLLLWPPKTGYLPQYQESITYMMGQFGLWYRFNFYRLFSQGLEFVPLLFAGLVFLPLFKGAREDRFCHALIAYALLRSLIMLAANRFDIALIYHDRYNLVSYLSLSLAGLLCWVHILKEQPQNRSKYLGGFLTVGGIVAVTNLLATPVAMVDVRGKGQANGTVVSPSLIRVALYQARSAIIEKPGGGVFGIGFDLASRFLPKDAVVATTVIDPYLIQRPFLEMLPVSENIIDLSLPPETLKEAMLNHGATHLYLTEYSGLNAWMDPVIDHWLESLRKVPDLPEVHRLIYLNYSPLQGRSHGRQGIYEIKSTRANGNISALSELHGLTINLEPDGSWVVHWHPEPGGEINVVWQQAPNQAFYMGSAATELGQFPIRLSMPTNFVLEVTCLVKGKPIHTETLTAMRQ